jgi:hypothetical protein
MFAKLLQTIFLPKRTREKMASQSKPAEKQTQTPVGQPPMAAGRDELLTEAMTVYRAQMETYESLNAETRRQIEEDAAEAFGEVLAQRSTKDP